MIKKLLLFLFTILMFTGNVIAETNVYTLTPSSGSNNNYANNSDIVINGITWNLTGNSTMQPWRIGGKSLNSVDRTLYSKTPLSADVSRIEIMHGNASGITVNSMNVVISSDSDFTNIISTITPTFKANDTAKVICPENTKWDSAYYKIIYNVTVTGSSNKFLEFKKAIFYGELNQGGDSITTDTIPSDTTQVIVPELLPNLTYAAELTAGTNGSVCSVNEKDGIKVGTSKAGGDMTVTVGANANKLRLYAAVWNGVTNLSIIITGAVVSPDTLNLIADSGVANNSPFTLNGNEADYMFDVNLSEIEYETKLTFTTSTAKRFVIWNASYDIEQSVPTDVTIIKDEINAVKKFDGKQIVIIQDGKKYNILGQKL